MKTFLFILLFFGAALSGSAQHLAPDTVVEASAIQLMPDPPEVLFQCGFESLPQFPGGETGLFAYLRQNLVFPDSALKYGVQGTVRVRFVVACDGSISNIAVIKPLGFGLDAEAIRLVRKMPKWDTWHIMNGKPTTFYLPVRFYPE